MIYIEAELPDGTTINNIDVDGENVIIENSEGESLNFSINDIISVRLFHRVDIENVAELFLLYRNKKAYINVFDSEPSATFNAFPDATFKESIDDESITIDDLSNIRNYAIGIIKGKEKDITFKEIIKITNQNENEE